MNGLRYTSKLVWTQLIVSESYPSFGRKSTLINPVPYQLIVLSRTSLRATLALSLLAVTRVRATISVIWPNGAKKLPYTTKSREPTYRAKSRPLSITRTHVKWPSHIVILSFVRNQAPAPGSVRFVTLFRQNFRTPRPSRPSAMANWR